MYWAIAKRYQSIAGWRSTCVTSLFLTVYCTFVRWLSLLIPARHHRPTPLAKATNVLPTPLPIQLPLAKRAVAKEPNGEFSPRAKRPINNPDAADTRTDVPPAKTNPIPMASRDIAKQPQNPGGKKKKAAVVIEERFEEVIIGNAVPAARLMPAMAARRAMQPDNWRKEMERLSQRTAPFFSNMLSRCRRTANSHSQIQPGVGHGQRQVTISQIRQWIGCWRMACLFQGVHGSRNWRMFSRRNSRPFWTPSN